MNGERDMIGDRERLLRLLREERRALWRAWRENEADRLRHENAQMRTFLRFLLDDAVEPADTAGLASRIRNDVPRLLRGDKDVVIG